MFYIFFIPLNALVKFNELLILNFWYIEKLRTLFVASNINSFCEKLVLNLMECSSFLCFYTNFVQ